MATGLIQRRSRAGGYDSGPALHTTRRHLWRTSKYDANPGLRQGWGSMADSEDKVSRLAGGYNRLARDFDRAIVAARLDWPHHLLIQQAREASWTSSQIDGSGQPKPFRLNLSGIASDLEVDRSTLSRRHAELVSFRIFLEVGDGSHFINKDYRTWLDKDGSPRLSSRRADWSKKVRREPRAVATRPQSGPSLGSHSPSQSESPLCGYLPTVTVATYPQSGPVSPTVPYNRTVVTYPQSEASPQTPIGESPAPAPATHTRRESLESREREIDSAGARKPEPDPIESWASERVLRAFPGDDSMAEIMAIRAGHWVGSEGYSPADVKAAILKAIDKGIRPIGFIPYVHSILTNPKPPGQGRGPTRPAEPPREPGPDLTQVLLAERGRQASEVQSQDEALARRWQALAEPEREEIAAEVLRGQPHLKSNRLLLRAACVAVLARCEAIGTSDDGSTVPTPNAPQRGV